MRTSLTEIRDVDDFVAGKLSPEEALVFEAKAIVNTSLREHISLHKMLLRLLRQFQRKAAKDQVVAVSRSLFLSSDNRSFRDEIDAIFNH